MADRLNGGTTDDNASERPLCGLRCLVLDDDLLIALDIEHALRTAGAEHIISVGNVADFLAALGNEMPLNVAVLDIDLGTEDGMIAPAALRQRGIPFIFLTGMGGDDPRARKYPDVPVVDKPYQGDALLAALRRTLHRQ